MRKFNNTQFNLLESAELYLDDTVFSSANMTFSTASVFGGANRLFDPANPETYGLFDDGFDPTNGTDLNSFIENGSGSTTAAIVASGDQGIDGLLSGTSWAGGSITYSDPDAVADYQAGHPEVFTDFAQMTAQQMEVFHFGLNSTILTQNPGAAGFAVSGFSALDISYAGSGSGAGTIRSANTSDPGTAYAYSPSGGVWGGDAFFGPAGDLPDIGDYDWHTFLHELGHSLGLAHGHTGGGFGAMPAALDSVEYSVMTYRTYIGGPLTGYTYESFGAPQTFMMYDIAALQYMYGANFTINSTNTTYTWTPGSGDTLINGQLALDPGANRIFATIWDGGGTDTYDLSAYTTALAIDLRPGNSSLFSSVQQASLGSGELASGNIYNALQFMGDVRSLIENARGGSAGDSIIGNEAKNFLYGNGGDDTLKGKGGDDKLFGGDGIDLLRGGNGNDKLVGGAGNDILEGGNGDDKLLGGLGADVINGGAGIDIVSYTGATSGVTFTLVGGGTLGEALGDTYISIEILKGTNFNDHMTADIGDETLKGKKGDDMLFGGAGNDFVRGGNGADQLFGGADDDTLKGGKGDDMLTGGTGADTFIYKANQDNDTILDFEDNIDTINFTKFGFASVAAAQAFATQVGADVVYDFGGGDTLTVVGMTIAALANDIDIVTPPPGNGQEEIAGFLNTEQVDANTEGVDSVDIYYYNTFDFLESLFL